MFSPSTCGCSGPSRTSLWLPHRTVSFHLRNACWDRTRDDRPLLVWGRRASTSHAGQPEGPLPFSLKGGDPQSRSGFSRCRFPSQALDATPLQTSSLETHLETNRRQASHEDRGGAAGA